MVAGSTEALLKMISQKKIGLNVQVKNWEEAVRAGGKLLVSSGEVEECYIDAMVRTVRSMGPYIVIAPGVALPHARPEDGVKIPCMSLITLKTPVNFGNKINDPVRLVISFATVDKEKHIEALTALARIIGDRSRVEALMNAKEIENIWEVISQSGDF